MAHIIDFSIKGLAGRKEAYSKKLNKDVNVFFGLNGSGKTTLLKILHSAVKNNAEVIRDSPFDSAEVRMYSVDADTIFTRRIENTKKEIVHEDPSQYYYSIEEGILKRAHNLVRAHKENSSDKWEWETTPKDNKLSNGGFRSINLPTSRLSVIRLESRNESTKTLVKVSEEQLDKYFSSSVQSLWRLYTSSMLKEVRKAQEDGLANILKSVLSPSTKKEESANIDIEVAFKRAAAFLTRQGSPDLIGSQKDFEAAYKSNEQLRSVVNDINEVENNIEISLQPRDKLQNLVNDLLSSNKEIKFSDDRIEVLLENGKNLGLENLSSGEKQLLRILVENMNSGLRVTFIDEPEISMHVDWQIKLIDSIQILNPQSQMIIATHSPEIMANVSDDKIFRL